MTQRRRQGIVFTLFIIVLLVIDQTIKVCVKTNMCLHESIRITDWWYITFVENNGMAYGMTFIPKYALSIFRMAASAALIWYLRQEILRGARLVWLTLISMVIAGAVGNLIDCMFYGMMFTDSTSYLPSAWVDFGSGYAPFLQGRVVDMFYFPLIVTTYPDWFPIWGGQPYIFFSPVFNFADACISVSVVAILLCCRKELSRLTIDKD
jgi:signal peptidase II